MQSTRDIKAYRGASENLLIKNKKLKESLLARSTDKKISTLQKDRRALPVFTKADEVFKMTEDHEVIICMAATGSGKSTQLPQIILDKYTENGKGASCNIFCTQPRRIAAISVAQRVAKERGETIGQSVGYQVRFEARLPTNHGSITFCTIGIFLKKMRSSLSADGQASIDDLKDVSHVIVDEVHERDVDTDLLLVMLRRLLQVRRAQKNPLKIILMSATIDPSLFQQYFRSQDDALAPIAEIPGRSFPVDKQFLDDFLPQLRNYPQQEGGWVFQETDTIKYLDNEMRYVAPQDEHRAREELPIPAALVALTIAHIIKTTDEGHLVKTDYFEAGHLLTYF